MSEIQPPRQVCWCERGDSNPMGLPARMIAYTAKAYPTSLMRHLLPVLVTRHWPSEVFRKIRDAVGMGHATVLHSTRHTFCKLLGSAGADAFTVQRLAGHSSVVISQRYTNTDSKQKGGGDCPARKTEYCKTEAGKWYHQGLGGDGGMADAQRLGRCAERRAGSTPVPRTKIACCLCGTKPIAERESLPVSEPRETVNNSSPYFTGEPFPQTSGFGCR
jgi:Phage integrase family